MQIKFLTINIWFGGKIWDNLIEFIHQESPDILFLQEVYDGHDNSMEKRFRTMNEFKREFGDFLPHSAFGATVIDTGHSNIPWGQGIFSKYPLKNARTIFFDLPLTYYDFLIDADARLAAEGMLECEIDINGMSIFGYSWHGVWNNHGGDSPERTIMEHAIIENIGRKERVILAGDSNMRPDSTTIKNIGEKLNLQNVFAEELESTFNMLHKKNPELAHESVDKLFVSKNITVVSHEMPKVDVSDHYPLKATLHI